MNTLCRALAAFGFGAACLMGPGAALAQQQQNCGEALNYEDADLRAVIDEIAIRTGRTFLLDPAVQGRVNVKSPPNGGLCADEAWELFQAILRANDFVATPIGDGKYRIVPLQEAARTAGPVGEGKGSDLTTQIVRLKYVDAREAAANLAQIIGNNGVVSPVRTGNAVIIVDTADNAERIRSVLQELDRDTTTYRTVALKYASAGEVARLVREIGQEMTEENGGRGGFSVVAAEASNSLLIRAEPSLMRRLELVIGELDQYGEATSELAVVALKHANAEELAPLLEEVANNVVQGGEGGGTTISRSRATVSFHKPTNSIIINGDANIQRTLQNVIAKLDVRRPQVQVEAIIVEISDTAARELGVQYFLTGDNIPFSATNYSAGPNIYPAAGAALLNGSKFTDVFETPSTTITDANGVVTNTETESIQSELAKQALQSLIGVQGLTLGGGFEFGDGNIFGGILTALKNDSDSNVLSTPSVVTLNNTTARLQVGQEIPITTGEAIGDNFSNAFRTISREQVGVILEVTPQINDGDTVTMEIVQEISSIAGPINTSSTDLITNKREITTTALVDNGDILVIGGLVDDTREERSEKVPLLGDIPGVGNLFKSSSKERRRQNLMVFIRPTVIRDQETAQAATKRKFDYMRARELLRDGQPVSEMERLINDVTGVEAPAPDSY
ncbi:type II secretion system secretin GspD [Hyphococcus luteus]|uniref:Type II secretion system protein GspD n=1 Tax=Hyphococcus luteus TaxID=2058213 RepID=A0A2S7K2Y3_9PROT|nr:type II secretion system secretin GspD [Marinicaulis flavus]PQA86808.1 type II secretion system protein GspD [Marinicaulis flavus]